MEDLYLQLSIKASDGISVKVLQAFTVSQVFHSQLSSQRLKVVFPWFSRALPATVFIHVVLDKHLWFTLLYLVRAPVLTKCTCALETILAISQNIKLYDVIT